MSRLRLLLLSAALLASPAVAGTITAELDRTEGSVDDAYRLTLNIEGEREGDPALPEVPGLVFQQAGYSESTVISNGRRTTELSLTFLIRAQQAGDYRIPSITAQLDGKQEATLPLTLKVKGPGGQVPQGQAQQAPPQGQQSQPQAQQGNKPGRAGSPDTGGVFIERECDNVTPYVGQPLVCAIRVYHRGNLNGGQRVAANSPDFRRFPVEGEKRYQRVVSGQRYGVIELREIVVPTKPGALELAPYTLQARVLTWTRKNNPLDKFFDNFNGGFFNFDLSFTEEKEVTVKSEATTLQVKPFPDAGKPAGFAGTVGDFQMNAQVSKGQVAAGDTITITINIIGDGILDTLGDVGPKLDSVGKVYADKPEYSEQITPDAQIRSSKTYKYALVPTKPGTYALGAVELPVFNPKTGTYTVLRSELGQLIVDPGKAEAQPLVVGNQQPTGTQKKDVKALGKDLLDLHRHENLLSQQTITNSDKLMLTAVGTLPLGLAFSLTGVSFLRRRRQNDTAGLRRSKAHRTFRDGSHAALAEIEAGRVEQGLGLAHRAFRGYVGDKANVHGSSLAAREIDGHLAALGAGEGTRAKAAEAIGRLEQVEFGGVVPPAGNATELVKALEAVVDEVEKA